MKQAINIITIIALLPWPLLFMTAPMMFANPQPGKSVAIGVMAVLSYPIYIGLIYLIFGLNFYGLSGMKFFLISLVAVLGITSLFGLPYTAVRNFLGYDLKGTILRKGDAVYFNGKKIEGLDINSATVNIEGDHDLAYATDKDFVYFQGLKIEGSHGPSFKKANGIQDKYANYFVDKNQVYYHGKVLENANPEKFEVTDFDKANDGSNYYIYGKRLDLKGDIIQIDRDYFHDGHNLFSGAEIIEGSLDLKTFKFVDRENNIASDKNGLYALSGTILIPLTGIDSNELKIHSLSHIGDNDQVLFISYREKKTHQLSVADPSSFSFIKDSFPFARDQTNLYVVHDESASIVTGVDRESFQKVKGDDDFTNMGYFKDKNQVYYFHRENGEPYTDKYIIVEGADLESFKERPWHLKHKSNAYDKNHSYNDGVRIQ